MYANNELARSTRTYALAKGHLETIVSEGKFKTIQKSQAPLVCLQYMGCNQMLVYTKLPFQVNTFAYAVPRTASASPAVVIAAATVFGIARYIHPGASARL